MRRLILGTAGHIDHGKTTLVRALTGVDTDRLPDEKRRGITIDLGFASLSLQDGLELGIVDVPGHEGFIRNMLAGATGIDLALLVVAADEGVMPQTREHLAIVELLGVRAGVVAVTKTDLVERDWLELVLDDLRDALAATAFAGAPLLPVSATSGEGLDALRETLAASALAVEQRSQDDLFRLPVDRVFTVRGTGTVVTGTIWSGRVARDAMLDVLPGGHAARVRGVQVHGEERAEAGAGTRVALALAGVDRDSVARGEVLVSGGAWQASPMLTTHVRLLPHSDWRLRSRQRVRVHLGTAEVMARVALLQGGTLEPGGEAWAQLRLEAPLVARAGDRFVLRSYSPVTTIGGGTVVEPSPPKRKRLREGERDALEAIGTGEPAIAVRARLRLAGWEGLAVEALPIQTPWPRRLLDPALATLGGEALRVGGEIFDGEVAAEARRRLTRAVDAFHAEHPLRPGIDHEELRRALPERSSATLREWALTGLLEEGALEAAEGVVARAGYVPRLTAEQQAIRDAILDAIVAARLAPPTLPEMPEDLRGRGDFWPLLKLLEQQREVVPVGPELYFSRAALETAVAEVRRRLGGREDATPADFREVLGVSRKFLIPLLEHFDRQGVTSRRGDARAVAAETETPDA